MAPRGLFTRGRGKLIFQASEEKKSTELGREEITKIFQNK
jgi:hypothetical protein